MSKPIKMTQELLDECRQDFEKALKLAKLADGKLNFTKTFTCGSRKAVVFYTPEAYAKMVMLIKEFDKEVAWHGVAKRSDDESKDEYIITDILVYPQSVTGASVEMDTKDYAIWIADNIEDGRLCDIHMQGHSHVNMAPNPSSTDLVHQEDILNMLNDNDFYIFTIWNKSFVNNTKIYDMKKNILFENGDVTTKVVGGTEDLDAFIKTAKEMVKTKEYSRPNYSGVYSGQSNVKKDVKEDVVKRKNEKQRTKVGWWRGSNKYEQDDAFDYYDEDYYYGYH